MPRVGRREARDLDVVPHDVVIGGKLVHLTVEELLLVVPTRSPRQHAADVEVLAEDVPHHVGRRDALSGALVVRASCRVDVVVAGSPTLSGKMNPPREMELLAMLRALRNGDLALLDVVFRAARGLHRVVAGRQTHGLAVGAVHLVMEEEVRR